jgi:hypothetical protein
VVFVVELILVLFESFFVFQVGFDKGVFIHFVASKWVSSASVISADAIHLSHGTVTTGLYHTFVEIF